MSNLKIINTMKTYKNYNSTIRTLMLLMALSISILSCAKLGGRLGMNNGIDSDEEAKQYNEDLTKEIEKDKERIEGHKKNIATAQGEKEYLGIENEHLKHLTGEKGAEINKVLLQLHDDSAHDRDLQNRGYSKCTFTVDCEKCHRKVEVSFSRFNKLIKKYRTGYTQYEQYRWFLWWEWNRHVTGYTFDKCFRCMCEEDMAKFEKSINNNKQQLAELEAKLVKERLDKKEAEHILAKDERGRDTVSHQSQRRRHYREELANSRAELEETKGRHAQEMLQKTLEMARVMLNNGVPRAAVMAATGLSDEQLNNL